MCSLLWVGSRILFPISSTVSYWGGLLAPNIFLLIFQKDCELTPPSSIILLNVESNFSALSLSMILFNVCWFFLYLSRAAVLLMLVLHAVSKSFLACLFCALACLISLDSLLLKVLPMVFSLVFYLGLVV